MLEEWVDKPIDMGELKNVLINCRELLSICKYDNMNTHLAYNSPIGILDFKLWKLKEDSKELENASELIYAEMEVLSSSYFDDDAEERIEELRAEVDDIETDYFIAEDCIDFLKKELERNNILVHDLRLKNMM